MVLLCSKGLFDHGLVEVMQKLVMRNFVIHLLNYFNLY